MLWEGRGGGVSGCRTNGYSRGIFRRIPTHHPHMLAATRHPPSVTNPPPLSGRAPPPQRVSPLVSQIQIQNAPPEVPPPSSPLPHTSVVLRFHRQTGPADRSLIPMPSLSIGLGGTGSLTPPSPLSHSLPVPVQHPPGPRPPAGHPRHRRRPPLGVLLRITPRPSPPPPVAPRSLHPPPTAPLRHPLSPLNHRNNGGDTAASPVPSLPPTVACGPEAHQLRVFFGLTRTAGFIPKAPYHSTQARQINTSLPRGRLSPSGTSSPLCFVHLVTSGGGHPPLFWSISSPNFMLECTIFLSSGAFFIGLHVRLFLGRCHSCLFSSIYQFSIFLCPGRRVP